MSKRTRVAILGGGVGGLSAAHELAELGSDFEVHVYEAGERVGGKAQSQFIPGTGRDGRRDLPGEHGFRFFPAWYKHIPDIMRRTPLPSGGSVLDNLIGCTEMGVAEAESNRVHRFKRHAPSDAGQFFDMVHTALSAFQDAEVPLRDPLRFGMKMIDFMLLCEERRRDCYETTSFFDFAGGAIYTERFRRYLNSSRFMVAMDARRGSACTIGNKVLQMLIDFRRPHGENDRVLNGPTTTQWLEPWESHLRSLGVTFHLGKRAQRLEVDVSSRRIKAAWLAEEADPVMADVYIAALPIEKMQALVTDELASLDGALSRLRRATKMTASMVGAQYFLRRDVDVCDGHVAYPSAPWALSSISQAGFWNRGKPEEERFDRRYGDGSARGLLSIDISDWEAVAPRLGKTAAQCVDREQVLREAWEQLKEALNTGGESRLADADLVLSYLDEHVRFTARGAHNEAPLLVHPPGSWYDRPKAALDGVHNLFLAADYVQTGTDLATMEGANEAARLSVNALLEREGRAERAATFSMVEDAGALVRRAKERDRKAWVEERIAPPPLVKWPIFRDDEGPTLDDALRYQEAWERALRGLDPLDR